VELIVASRAEVEAGLVVRAAYVVISITDPDKRPARIPQPTGWRATLPLRFHDAVPVELTVFRMPPEVVFMDAGHARQIREFVDRWRNEVGAIVVHCEQGMSRSPAVAAAVSEYLGEDSGRFFRQFAPNEHVYQTLRSVLEGDFATGEPRA